MDIVKHFNRNLDIDVIGHSGLGLAKLDIFVIIQMARIFFSVSVAQWASDADLTKDGRLLKVGGSNPRGNPLSDWIGCCHSLDKTTVAILAPFGGLCC